MADIFHQWVFDTRSRQIFNSLSNDSILRYLVVSRGSILMTIRHPLLLLVLASYDLTTSILLIRYRCVSILILESWSNTQAPLLLAKLSRVLLLLDVVWISSLVRSPDLIGHHLLLPSYFSAVILISHTLHTNATSTAALLLNHLVLLVHKLRVHHICTLLVICWRNAVSNLPMLCFAFVEANLHQLVAASAPVGINAIRTSLVCLSNFTAVLSAFSPLGGTLLNISVKAASAILKTCSIGWYRHATCRTSLEQLLHLLLDVLVLEQGGLVCTTLISLRVLVLTVLLRLHVHFAIHLVGYHARWDVSILHDPTHRVHLVHTSQLITHFLALGVRYASRVVLAAVSWYVLHRQSPTIHQDCRLLVVKGVVLLGSRETRAISRNAHGASGLRLSLSIRSASIILRGLSLELILRLLLESDPASMTMSATPRVSHREIASFSRLMLQTASESGFGCIDFTGSNTLIICLRNKLTSLGSKLSILGTRCLIR